MLLLLFLSGLFVLIYNKSVTLQNTASAYSVSGLTDQFSVFVPTRISQSISAADAKLKERQKIHQKYARNSKVRIRPGAADSREDLKRQRKKQDAKFTKGVMKGIRKTLGKHVNLRIHSAVQSNLNVGSGQILQNISKAEIYKRNSYVPPGNSQPIQTLVDVTSQNNQMTQSKTKYQLYSSDGSLSDVRSIPKSKVPLNEIENQTTTPSVNTVVRSRSNDGNGRSSSETMSGVRVIIVAHGRSGSSFFGGIFNAHPDFFFIYEPLNYLKKIVDQKSEEFMDSTADLINAIFKCNFENDTFLEIISRGSHHRASSRPLVSPPFCKSTYEEAIHFVANLKWKLCSGRIGATVLNNICRKYSNIATKILLENIVPADLSWILYITDSHFVPSSLSQLQPTVRASDHEIEPPVYVLYLVRDPRAMIYSRNKLGWLVPRQNAAFAFESGEADNNVRKVCDTIELNLGAFLRHPRRIKLVRYEELATNPERVVRNLFSELHISPSKEVFRWIYNKTHGPVELSALSLSRNANVSINAWREKISDKLLEIIEMRCERVMKYLGYLPTYGSQKILRDLHTPLYLNKIRDFRESY